MKKYRKYLVSSAMIAIAVGVAASPTVAAAQEAAAQANDAESGIQDIVVTAQRRSERLQDVPISITAVTQSELTNSGVDNTMQLQSATPGLNVAVAANGNTLQPRIRGVGASTNGPGIENSVATYVDGVYVASSMGSLLTLANIDHVEVLMGPQGTLFGRNATGGLIHVITKDPTEELSGKLSVTYGNYDTLQGSAYIAGGLGRGVRADLSVQMTRMGKGFGRDTLLGTDNYRTKHDLNVRSKWILEPGVGTKITLIGDYSDRKSIATYAPYGGNIIPQVFRASNYTGSLYDTDSDSPNNSTFRAGGASLRIDQDIGDLKLMSLTAYRQSRSLVITDFDVSPSAIITVNPQVDKSRQFSQELQLQSPTDRPFRWIVGAYFFDATGKYDPNTINFGGPLAFLGSAVTRVAQRTRSYAGFAQADFEIAKNTTLTGGIRYTYEKRDLSGTVTALTPTGQVASVSDFTGPKALSQSFDKVTFRAAVNHKFSSNLMAYASFNRGFKSGGYNPNDPTNAAFKPEVLDAYEVGLKSDPIPGILRLNLSAFYYDYSNIQVNKFVAGTAVILNGAAAEIYGGEINLVASPTPNLRITAGASILHDRFKQFDNADFYIGCGALAVPCKKSAAGFPLPNTPRFTGNVAVDYTVPMANGSKFLLNANVYHNSGASADVAQTFRIGSYDFVNASITWKDANDRFSASVWGRNLGDEVAINQIAFAATGGVAYVLPPRTYGVTLGFNF